MASRKSLLHREMDVTSRSKPLSTEPDCLTAESTAVSESGPHGERQLLNPPVLNTTQSFGDRGREKNDTQHVTKYLTRRRGLVRQWRAKRACSGGERSEPIKDGSERSELVVDRVASEASPSRLWWFGLRLDWSLSLHHALIVHVDNRRLEQIDSFAAVDAHGTLVESLGS